MLKYKNYQHTEELAGQAENDLKLGEEVEFWAQLQVASLSQKKRFCVILNVVNKVWDSFDNLKRRVRKLKHFEKTIRSQNSIGNDIPLVWDKFFDLRNNPNDKALYTLSKLANMSQEDYKVVVDAFFARVYYEIYAYKGITNEIIYDVELLAQLDLPPVADEIAVRKRFREMAKVYHPDAGGDAAKFIKLMQAYRKLIESN